MIVATHPRVRANRERITRITDRLVAEVRATLADRQELREGLYWLGVARAALLAAADEWDDPA